MRNNTGPNTDPWGTPLVTDLHPENEPFIHTLCLLPFSHSSIHPLTLPEIPCAFIFLSSRSWGTLSKAFTKSRNTTSTDSPWSTHLVTISKKASRLLKQEPLFLNPCCDSAMSSYLSRCLTIASLMIVSNILQ